MMFSEPLFWYGLVLKMAMTASIVVLASVAVERSGPFIGALIAALPTAAGATYLIMALEHPPAFIAASAVGSAAANAAVATFALTYAVLAQRHGIVLSITLATLVWFAAAAALRLVDWTPESALALNALVYSITIPASARYRRAAVLRESSKRRRYDLALRAAAAALVVAAVTTASHRIGAFVSGTFAVFPIVMASFAVILHPRFGGPAAAAVFAHAQPALVGLGLGFLAVHFLVEPLGVWWAFAGGLAVAMSWSAALWLVRRMRIGRAWR
ncbi:MAG TPA: hypothetical protein VH934_00830 [Xanthobacteraceae bacterium]|jgi:uncharacterized membrane protein (GlpM family)